MSEPDVPRRAARPRRRIGRIAALTVLVALLCWGVLTYVRLTSPERLRGLVRTRLQHYADGCVSVGSATFSWRRGLCVIDLVIRESADPASPSLFTCRQIDVSLDRMALLGGRTVIDSILVREPSAVIVRHAVDGSTTFAGLGRLSSSRKLDELVSLPSFELRDASLRIVYRDAQRDREVENLELTIRGRPSLTNARFYDLVWRGGSGNVTGGHSQFDLRTGVIRNVRGGLPWTSLEAVMIAVNAEFPAAGAWSDLLELTGRVRARDFQLGRLSTAVIDLDDAALSIPINDAEKTLGAADRYLRFQHVHGTIHVNSDAIRMEFTAGFHESSCRVIATLRGSAGHLDSLDDVDVEASVTAEGLRFPRFHDPENPAETRFIEQFPELARFYGRFDPHGALDLRIAIVKHVGENEPVEVRHGLLTARGCDAAYLPFPYRVEELQGSVEFTDRGVFLHDLHGIHGAGRVQVDGWLESTRGDAAAALEIEGENISIDSSLYLSAPSSYRGIADRLCPEGTLDVRLLLAKPRDVERGRRDWRSLSTIEFRDAVANVTDLPCSVTELAGTVIVDRDRLSLVGVEGRVGDAQVSLSGAARLDDGSVRDLRLGVHARDVSIDERLFAAAPLSVQRALEALHPSGRCDIRADVTFDDNRAPAYTSTITLCEASIFPRFFPVFMDDIRGSFLLTPERVTFGDLTGRFGDTTLSLIGKVDWAVGSPTADVTVRVKDLVVDDALHRMLPPKLRDGLGGWRANGFINLAVSIQGMIDDPDQAPDIRAIARFEGSTLEHPFFPKPFRNVRGVISADREGATADDLRAEYGAGDIRASYQASLGREVHEGDISVTALGLDWDDLPWETGGARANGGSSALSARAAIDLYLDHVRYVVTPPNPAPTWTVEGRARLHEVEMSSPIDLHLRDGTVTLHGRVPDEAGGRSLWGNLAVREADLYGRRLENIEAAWSHVGGTEGQDGLVLDDVEAEIYGGQATGRLVTKRTSASATYNLTTMIRGMNIEPLINAAPRRSPQGGASEPVDVRGRADAYLFLEGNVGDVSSRRGGGRVQVTEGHMVRLPIILAILQVINLSIPSGDAFDEADLEFLVSGDRVEFTDIRFRGAALGLLGKGTMSLPDQGLNLDLAHVNPRLWGKLPLLGDIVEGASRQVVQLHVTGPAYQPTVRSRPFRGVTEEFRKLFQKKPPKKIEAKGS